MRADHLPIALRQKNMIEKQAADTIMDQGIILF